MIWNSNNGQGPWGARGGQGAPLPPQRPSGETAVADGNGVDSILRQAQQRLRRALGGGNGSQGGGGAEADGMRAFGLVAAAVVIFWLGSGFYRVLPEENAVILTFGKWTSTRGEPGLGYHLPWPVQAAVKVNVAFDRRVEIGFRDASRAAKTDVAPESQMLTGDENIVDIDFVVTWRIADARKYLFEIRDPETTVKKVAESALREIVGREKIQRALTEGRADIEAKAKELMQKMLEEYNSGIVVSGLQLLRVDPPQEVVDAFDDVQRARADKERIKNEAEAYRNDILPRARGDAQKMIRDAEGYREAVVRKAEGDSARFLAVEAQHRQAKDVTEKRIYIETMEEILRNSKKLIVGEGQGALLPYLPLDAAKPKPPAEN